MKNTSLQRAPRDDWHDPRKLADQHEGEKPQPPPSSRGRLDATWKFSEIEMP
jgi:hypothetical protein